MKEKAPLVLAVVVPKVIPEDEEPLKRLKVTLVFASALPVIVGVESFGAEILTTDVGASGEVVSNELVPELEESTLPVLVDLPAKVSIGNNRNKPNVDNKTVVL